MNFAYLLITVLMILGTTSMVWWAYVEESDNYLFAGLTLIGMGIIFIGLEFYLALRADSEVNEEFV